MQTREREPGSELERSGRLAASVCPSEEPPGQGDGCGSELDWWFRDAVLNPPPPKDPPKPRVMIIEGPFHRDLKKFPPPPPPTTLEIDNYPAGTHPPNDLEAVTAIAERANHFLLEYDTPRAGDFAPLRFVPKGKGVVLGLISSKTPALEQLDLLRRRAEEAAKYIDLDRLAISPQCGFASVMVGNETDEETQWRKLELVTRVADDLWPRSGSPG